MSWFAPNHCNPPVSSSPRLCWIRGSPPAPVPGTVHSGPNRFPTTRMLRVLANYPVGAMKAVVFHGIGDIHLGGSARPQNSGAHGCYRPPHREAMMKNLTLGMGNCNHRKYIPLLIELVSGGVFDPSTILTQ